MFDINDMSWAFNKYNSLFSSFNLLKVLHISSMSRYSFRDIVTILSDLHVSIQWSSSPILSLHKTHSRSSFGVSGLVYLPVSMGNLWLDNRIRVSCEKLALFR